jgi:hypothetical protein
MRTVLFCLGTAGVASAGLAGVGARPAWAGYCDEESAASVITGLEAYAKKPTKEKPYLDHICMDMAATVPKLVKRTLAACTKVLEREPDFANCTEWSVKLGAKQLGTIDLFERVGATFKLEPFTYGSQTLPIYEALGDARAVPLVLEAWKAALADKRAKQERHAHTFRVWRHAALRLFAKLGGATERAFLEEQQQELKDKGLQKAIKKTLAEIEKRAAQPAKPAP